MTMELTETQIQGRAAYSTALREQIALEVNSQHGNDDNNLWRTARQTIATMSLRLAQTNQPAEFFTADLHDLWHIFIQAAMLTSAHHPAQDRLVAQVLYAREMGVLRAGMTVTEANGRQASLWSDLPFLATDLREASAANNLSAAQRLNLDAFVARLLALRICGDALGWCALRTMREVLETPSASNSSSTESDVQLVLAWLQYAGHKLASMSYVSVQVDGDGVAPGQLAATHVAGGGFSKARWQFWSSRLTEIGGKEALRGVEMMKNKVAQCGLEKSKVDETR